MKTLSGFTPAETLLLLHGSSTPLKDLLKYTMMDLLLKKVFITSKQTVQPNFQASAYTATYVKRGGRYASYIAKPHELIFITPFSHSLNTKIMFRHLAQIAYRASDGKEAYQKQVYMQPDLRLYISRNIFQYILGRFSINPAGKKIAEELQKELSQLEANLPVWLNSDKRKAIEAVLQVKGNIFLLKNFDFKLLHEIDQDLAHAETVNYDSYEGAFIPNCGFSCSTWTSFDHYSHSFDSSCGSSDSWGSSCGNSCGSSCGSSCGGGCGGGGD